MTVQSTASLHTEPGLKSTLQASPLHCWSPPQNVAHFLQEIKGTLTGSSGNAETIGHWIINQRIKRVIRVKKKKKKTEEQSEEPQKGVAMWQI